MKKLKRLTLGECRKQLQIDSIESLVRKQNEIVEAKGAVLRSQLSKILLVPVIERYELPREGNVYLNAEQLIPCMNQIIKNHELIAHRKYGIKSISVDDALKKFNNNSSDENFNYFGRRDDFILYKDNLDLYLFLFKKTNSL